MHRLASCPGVDPPEDVVLVEQPAADVLFLSSAATDLSTLAAHLASAGGETWRNQYGGCLWTVCPIPRNSTTTSPPPLITQRWSWCAYSAAEVIGAMG